MRDRADGLEFGDDTLGTTSIVSKTLEIAIVLLYITLLATVLFGNVVPSYRSAVGEEVAQRTLAATADDVHESIPPEGVEADVEVDVDLPDTIAGRSYRIEATDDRLSLSHPDPTIDVTVPLVLDDRIESVRGTLTGGSGRIRVVDTGSGIEVRLS